MSDFLIYSLSTMGLQILFLLLYALFFSKETFFNINRWYLLGSFLLTLLIPLIEFSTQKVQNKVVQLNEIIILMQNEESQSQTIASSFQYISILESLYACGVIFFLITFIYKVSILFNYKKRSKIEKIEGIKVYRIPNSEDAFSFLHFIFIGDKHTDVSIIMQHELLHKKKRHSIDLLFLEILKIIFWFNPLIYNYQKKITAVHEFEADAFLVEKYQKNYYQNLINQIFKTNDFVFTNTFFNQSLIKKRIVMLQKSKSKKANLVKYAFAIPVMVTGVFLFSNCNKEVNTAEPITVEVNQKYAKDPISMSAAELDQIPLFKGCENATSEEATSCFNKQMMEHVKTNFTYPEEAAKYNIEGRVSVQFVIDENGNVSDIEAKGPENGDLLEKEAIRIVASLPQFVPGKVVGKPVKVKYGLPITFKLQ